MKILISALTILTSTAVLAIPTVGDYVKYDVAVVQGGSSTPIVGTIEQTLSDFDAAKNQYFQTTTTTITGGASSQSQDWVNATDLLTDAGIAQLVNNCAGVGGQTADVQTAAGVLHTCAVPVSNDKETSTYWVGSVPFGIVQADIVTKSNGNHTQAVINSFRIGSK